MFASAKQGLAAKSKEKQGGAWENWERRGETGGGGDRVKGS